MKHISSILALVVALMIVSSCSDSKVARKAVEIQYNPMIESFTSGAISRRSSAEATLTEPLPEAVADLAAASTISPSVAGTFTIGDDRRRVIFTPDTEFERGEMYTMSLKLTDLYPDRSDVEDFAFSFRTMPAAATARLTGFMCNDDGGYDIRGVLTTADFEDSTQITRMVEWTKSPSVTWTHSADGLRHTFCMNDLKPTNKPQTITLSVDDKKQGYPEEELLQIEIPDNQTFAPHSIDYVSDDESYIELRMSQPLDPDQDLDGLVYIDDVACVRQVESNVVRLYPEQSDNATLKVNIDQGLRSETGQTLGTSATYDIDIEVGKPAVRFIGSSTILPAEQMEKGVPFQARGLRAVTLRIFRTTERNMGQLLQENDINQTPNLMRVARPVACTTIFLDQKGAADLNNWNTYSLDLSEILKPEPGALYTLSLDFNRSYAAIECVPQADRITPEQAAQYDAAEMARVTAQFDTGGYYWSNQDYDWNTYNWRDRDMPCTPSYYYNRSAERTLLVTDIGVIAKVGEESSALFIVNSITKAEPISGAVVDLYNFQGSKIATGTTGSDGSARIDYTTSAPYYAIVSAGAERTYLRMNSGAELSTSTFDVSGEVMQDGLLGFVYTERGVWRPGDTIHMNLIMNKPEFIPESHPVTVELRSPMGQIYQRRVAPRPVGGIYTFTLSTTPDAPTGVWTATIQAGGATFTKRVRIESIKPNRLKIDLQLSKGEKIITGGKPLNATLHGEWLTGARAGNLKYTIETELAAAPGALSALAAAGGSQAYKDYLFDNPYQTFKPEMLAPITGTTNAQGDATITATLNAAEQQGGGMLTATLTTRLFEPSGESSVDAMTIPYSPFSSYVGIMPPDGYKSQLNTDQNYRFKIATLTPTAQPNANTQVEVVIYQVEWRWWWNSNNDNLASYVADRNMAPTSTERITTDGQGLGSFEMRMPKNSWGTYYVTARDMSSGHTAAVLIYMDWPDYGNRRMGSTSDGAMRLGVSLDKENYNVGDKATVSFPASAGSRAIITIENGAEVLETIALPKLSDGDFKHSFKVTAAMQPNVYVNVTLLQPYGNVENDLPVRLYGIAPMMVSSPESHIVPVIQVPADVRPETELSITVSEKSGRPMGYTLAIVDEGLLDLTRFKTPNPWDAFNARVALGVRTWDIYNNVLGAYGGKIEQMFAIGGDDALLRGAKAAVNRFPPMVRYLGAFTLAKGKSTTHKIKLPAYMGRVKVMVVATSPTLSDSGTGAWGSAEQSVTVRAPLMLLGTAPRSVSPGDVIVVPATAIATHDGIGEVNLSIKTGDRFEVVGPTTQKTTIAKKSDRVVYFTLRVKEQGDDSGITINASGGGFTSRYSMQIPVRNNATPVSSSQSSRVAAGKSVTLKQQLGGIASTRTLDVEVSALPPINMTRRMGYLENYPYGCIEQITSAAFPLLYLPSLSDLTAGEVTAARNNVLRVLSMYKRYATPDGAMGYWPGNQDPNAWGSIYALHMMTVAGHRGYELPTDLYNRLRSVISASAKRWQTSDYAHLNLVQAYQLYVLALAGEPEIGAMNRLRQGGELTESARWMLASAYAVVGRTDVGRAVVATTTPSEVQPSDGEMWETYGSPLRLESIKLLGATLLGLSGEADALSVAVAQSLASDEWLSTQSTAWALVALGEYTARNPMASALEFTCEVAGEKKEVDSKKLLWNSQFKPKADTENITVTNNSKGTIYLRSVGSWIARGDSVPATSNGLSVTVQYMGSNGAPISVAALDRGVDFEARVTITNLGQLPLRGLMLTMPIASGWEILSVQPSPSAGVEYRDIRDDRVDNYIPMLRAGESISVTTRLSATYGGTFTQPAIRCSPMYDGTITGNTASSVVTVKN